jgi:hypothetical protein
MTSASIPIMPTNVDTGQNSSYRRGQERANYGEYAVGTIWLIFCAVGVVTASLVAPGANELTNERTTLDMR